jgi:hypothetical protein
MRELLRVAIASDGLPAEDVASIVAAVLDQIANQHSVGLVADIAGLNGLTFRPPAVVDLVTPGRPPLRNRSAIQFIERPISSAFSVISQMSEHFGIGEHDGAGVTEEHPLVDFTSDVIGPTEKPARPCLVSGFVSWEQCVDHHDELSDIAVVGLLLAAMAIGFDGFDQTEMNRFAAARSNPFLLKSDLHPVIGRLIVEMTEPTRAARPQDASSLATRLRAYRDVPLEFDLDSVVKAAGSAPKVRRTAIQEALRDRLFEVNRRNRLVYFRPTQASVNLTVGSVPTMLDVASLRPEQLVTWTGDFSARVVSGKPFALNSVLRFEEAPYLAGAIDGIVRQERRDRTEFGMGQLRLVTCFLNWHNLKEAPDERISSPLLLLPVTVTKRKGVADSYILTCPDPIAEVNPALRHHLKQLFGIVLPEQVDLSANGITDLHDSLVNQIKSSQPGVSLRLVDKPELRLIHRTAQIRVDQYRSRHRVTTTRRDDLFGRFAYSYRPRTLNPLGVQMFHAVIRDPNVDGLRRSLGLSVSKPQKPETQWFGPTEGNLVVSRRGFSHADGSGGNPYTWDLDLCSVTLSNFNYRKMTLVRDYSQLIERNEPSDAFDRIFSLDARPVDSVLDPHATAVASGFCVVEADETQRAAIARSADGRSYIIQGPPGTGKSQTITNLISDFVSRGKRVLFVCEKRAAIDVVYARLRAHGLDELCALIHDSQEDKRAFILEMKATYERWLIEPDNHGELTALRESTRIAVASLSATLQQMDRGLGTQPTGSDVPARALYERLSELRQSADSSPLIHPDVSAPPVAAWHPAASDVRQLSEAVRSVSGSGIIADHPIAAVHPDLLTSPTPSSSLESASRNALLALRGLQKRASTPPYEVSDIVTLRDAAQLHHLMSQLPTSAWKAVSPNSTYGARLDAAASNLLFLQGVETTAHETASGWTNPLAFDDARAALEIAKAKEGSALKFLNGKWRGVKSRVESGYDFSRHEIRPSVVTVLEQLVAVHTAVADTQTARALFTELAGTDDVGLVLSTRVALNQLTATPTRQFRTDLSVEPRNEDVTNLLSEVSEADSAVRRVFRKPHGSLNTACGQLESLLGAIGSVDLLVPALRRLEQADPRMAEVVRTLSAQPDEIERWILQSAVADFEAVNAHLPRMLPEEREHVVGELSRQLDELRRLNAAVLRSASCHRFMADVAIAETSATQLRSEDKELKKRFTAARRELEHEFGKTMRYRSIRELASGVAAPLVMHLRPVWLMSPLSVSDTLPLDPSAFDVVIFDEASQITLEEAIPSLYRSHQAIVVGDRMQLPPTQFFSNSSSGDDALLELVSEEEGDLTSVVLDGDSFLTQAASALPSTMLAWHYRSRSEDLIGFSNAAFYGGALATIPDRNFTFLRRSPIVVSAPQGLTLDASVGEAAAAAVLDRPISFHRLQGSVYSNRRNESEACYIAMMVRSLLMRRSGQTIGIAAFSEAQQGAIETQLEALAALDSEFARLLEAEELREVDEQFCGLFVKNLENLQGDERDIIIMSVCYGPNDQGRMLMNFGPINQRGGEKRLNVIFSRSKLHMAIITSITADAITNDHNDGARTLKQFLAYAQAHSVGDSEAAAGALRVVQPHVAKPTFNPGDVLMSQIASQLRAAGLDVEMHHGRSRFVIDLVVRSPESNSHQVAVLIDSEARCRTEADERASTHVGLLRRDGWHVEQVSAIQWWHHPESVIDRIRKASQPGRHDDSPIRVTSR